MVTGGCALRTWRFAANGRRGDVAIKAGNCSIGCGTRLQMQPHSVASLPIGMTVDDWTGFAPVVVDAVVDVDVNEWCCNCACGFRCECECGVAIMPVVLDAVLDVNVNVVLQLCLWF